MNILKRLFTPKNKLRSKKTTISSHPVKKEAQTSPQIPQVEHILKVQFKTKPIDWETKITDDFCVLKPISFTNEKEIILDLETADISSLSFNIKWNLSLCLAYGSNQLANATAIAIFKVISQNDNIEPLRWLSNIMLNTGDLPSGVDWEKGVKGLKTLLEVCPEKYKNSFYNLVKEETSYDIKYSYDSNQDDSEKVVFSHKTVKPDPYNTRMATYVVYRGDSQKAAYDFLMQKAIKEEMLFIVVETPEGNFCRDINGVYKERQ